ncbi:hypothetical protein D3C75_1301540 [compost metagenome]
MYEDSRDNVHGGVVHQGLLDGLDHGVDDSVRLRPVIRVDHCTDYVGCLHCEATTELVTEHVKDHALDLAGRD